DAAARVPGGAAALARAVADLVEDDLRAGPVDGADQVLARGRGDCVAHAVLFSAMARARGIPVRLVTGFRLEGHALVRHQWAIVEEDGARVAIDPTAGGAAAPGRYLALAVHGSSAAERALAADLAYARFSARPSGRSTPRTP
ncbi:MAG TPA: transglutaminase family protein, partial [Kofleriaceae bacterium]|nr:transglutaminase family protein [Kofleriaceae bacterium]